MFIGTQFLLVQTIFKKIIIELDKQALYGVMLHLYRVNITRERPLPGVDGSAKAMNMYVNIELARSYPKVNPQRLHAGELRHPTGSAAARGGNT